MATAPQPTAATVPKAAVLANEHDVTAAAERIAAAIAGGAADRDRTGAVPVDELESIRTSGLLAVTIPQDLGGIGVTTKTLVEAIRILARSDSSVSQVLQNHFVFVRHALHHGDQAQRVFFAELLLAGNRFGNALSERTPGQRKSGGLTTALQPGPDGDLILTGKKYYTTGALTAQWIPVFTLDVNGALAVAYVPRDSDGIEIVNDWNSFGQRGTHSGTTTLEQVRVNRAHVISWPVDPAVPNADAPFGQILHAAIDAGIAEAALAATVDFIQSKSRVYADSAADSPAQDPHILYETGRLAVRVRAANALLDQGSTAIDRAGTDPSEAQATEASLAVAAARAETAETAVLTANELFAIAGTHATDRKYGLDRYWRDARTHTLHDPTRWKYHHIANALINGVRPSGPLI